MSSWSCCRLCLDKTNLTPIFIMPELKHKYTAIILNISGVKIEMNDSLPQQLCSNCVNFINSCIKFRKKCIMRQKILKKNHSIFRKKTADVMTNIKQENEQYIELDIIDNFEIPNDCNDSKNLLTIDKMEKTDTDLPIEAKLIEDRKRPKLEESKAKSSVNNDETGCVVQRKRRIKKYIVVCEHCGKSCLGKMRLLAHCRSRHGYEKVDQCSFCDYRGNSAEQVRTHERIHTGERPYVCAECGAAFYRNGTYLQHVATHLPEKTVQCDQCPARFKSVRLMQTHKYRHKPKKYTFKCSLCHNNFSRCRNVVQHLRRIHSVVETAGRIERITIIE